MSIMTREQIERYTVGKEAIGPIEAHDFAETALHALDRVRELEAPRCRAGRGTQIGPCARRRSCRRRCTGGHMTAVLDLRLMVAA